MNWSPALMILRSGSTSTCGRRSLPCSRGVELDVADALGELVLDRSRRGAACPAAGTERQRPLRGRLRGAAELAQVDDPVVAGGLVVAVEAGVDAVVADDARHRLSRARRRRRRTPATHRRGRRGRACTRSCGRARRTTSGSTRPRRRPTSRPLESKATARRRSRSTSTWLNDSISATPSPSSLSSWATRFGGVSSTPESIMRVESSSG